MKLSKSRFLAASIFLVVAADWITKFLVQNHLFEGSFRTVVDGWVWLTHRQNTGVAFSFFSDADHAFRTPLLVAAALLGIFVAVHILRASADVWVRGAAALVIAGAAGNLGDRLVNGAVTDFILLRYFPFVFNVADVAITVGAIVLVARLVTAADAPEGGAATPTPS